VEFTEKLQKYAELAVVVGVGLEPGQRLLVRAPVETAPLAREVTRAAYRAGARLVDVVWDDDAVKLARVLGAPEDSYQEISAYHEMLLRSGERNDAVLSIRADDPDLYRDADPAVVSEIITAQQAFLRPYMAKITGPVVNWGLISAPIPSWAHRVYPDASPEEALEQLWEAIFSMVRVDRADPVAAWEAHLDALRARRETLNAKRFTALHFTAPGTDLTVGLPAAHRWHGGRMTTQGGIPFVPNLPTEEVFTLPHKDRVDGVVRATKPLSYQGTYMDGFEMEFEAGKVVRYSATTGEQHLANILGTDEGAGRLGEVALVPVSSPVSQQDTLFFNTLYDENASCHIALGKSYRFTLEGGESMTDEEALAAGGNDSLVHVDFMIGSPETDIDGITADGGRKPVFRDGEWVF
jgi:aminopeptidase